MKLKFFLLTFLVLFLRGCDFYSTSLWFFENPTGETNPLYRFFGVGWTGLIVVNIIVVGLIIYAWYFYAFKYSIGAQSRKPENLTDFISELYFNEKGKFYQVFYKMPENRKVLLAHSGYVVIRVVAIGSLLVTIHNLCQYYDVAAYNTFREIVKRPLFVIYGLIMLSVGYFYFRVWQIEFETAKSRFDSPETVS